MRRIIGTWFAILQMAVFAQPTLAQTHLQLALEDFVGHDQGIASGKTVDQFPIDSETKLQYFAADIDGNGVNEIFISRPDLASDGLWALYSDKLDKNGNIIKVGTIELYASNMRMAERDGVKGYYEYHPVSGAEGNLLFNSFDEDGNLMALWEAPVEPQGKDKELIDSLHLGRFDPKAHKPDIKVLPLRPVWESYVKRKQAKLHEGVENRVGARTARLDDPKQRAGRKDGELSGTAQASSKSWAWLIIGIVALFASGVYWYRSRFQR